MLAVIITILAVSFILYTLLGGADFGAGIVETFAGGKGERDVSKALAPVWEANHVWLILAIVIIFTGFPAIYSTVGLSLHIPLMVVLIGIVLRGSAFVFRYYDVSENRMHKYFSGSFKVTSFITPIFLGITLGAMLTGKISSSNDGSFYDSFIRPWFNLFCLVVGLFIASLFAYIAAVFLIGESKTAPERNQYTRLAKRFLIVTILLGSFVFVAAGLESDHLFNGFFQSPVSLTAFSMFILSLPALYYLFNHPKSFYLRGLVGLQVSLVTLGWFALHFPVIVYERDGNNLTFYNTRAPDATLYQLLIALFVGLLLIVPAFYFLFKVFKKPADG